MVTIKLSNKLHYSLITIAAILLIGVGVYAYGGTTPSTMGHSIGEIAPPSGCSAGQVLRMVPAGVGWDCVNVVSSIPSTYVRNVEYVSNTYTASTAYVQTSAYCPSGKKVLGGGCSRYGLSDSGDVVDISAPGYTAAGSTISSISGDYWYCGYQNSGGNSFTIHAFAICANIS